MSDMQKSAECGRGPCWKGVDHDGPCDPGSKGDPLRHVENEATPAWPPVPPVGDFVQTRDGGVWQHVEWNKFTRGSGYVVDWHRIGRDVIAHGTIHWRDPFGRITPPAACDPECGPEAHVPGCHNDESVTPPAEHRLTGDVGRQACACGWEPNLGEVTHRAFDRHLRDIQTTTGQDTP